MSTRLAVTSGGRTSFYPFSRALGTLEAKAEPTLKDVLNAIARLDAKVDRKVDELRADVDDLRHEVKKGFADLDDELTGHSKVHRELEKDIEALKRRPARTAARAPQRPRAR